MEPQSKEKVITFATSEHYQGAVELLKQCRTQISTIVADSEYHTLLNALTLEVESNLIQRFVVEIDNIRTGKNLNG
jgi:hypothetical protein